MLGIVFAPDTGMTTAGAQEAAKPNPPAAPPASPAAYKELAAAIALNLETQILAQWYPRAVNTGAGGFTQTYDEAWNLVLGTEAQRSIVYQSRLTWVASQIARKYPARATEFAAYTRHGATYLRDKMWDAQDGGFFWEIDATQPPPAAARPADKHIYGNSFAIYALASAYETTHDAATLDLAKRAFAWLEEHAHDGKNGGYFEALSRAGKPILAPPTPLATDNIGGGYGYKSMNSHIHLLEAFTELHAVWPDAKLKTRLEELFVIVRDRVAVAPGCLNLFFTPEWRAVATAESFGHDVETAYLLAEAAEALGKPDDKAAGAMGRLLVDHALLRGWDNQNGGFYDTGNAFGPPIERDKIWWTQAEGLNALLLLHEKYGTETPRYWEAFNRQWAFIRDHQVDATNKGWFKSVEANGVPIPGQTKSDAWTDPYHQGRALMNVVARLERLAK